MSAPHIHRPKRIIYSTSQFSRDLMTAEGRMREPTSLVHAKEFGTMLTVCGEQTASWVKFLLLPFRTVTSDRCLRCARILSMQADPHSSPGHATPVPIAS